MPVLVLFEALTTRATHLLWIMSMPVYVRKNVSQAGCNSLQSYRKCAESYSLSPHKWHTLGVSFPLSYPTIKKSMVDLPAAPDISAPKGNFASPSLWGSITRTLNSLSSFRPWHPQKRTIRSNATNHLVCIVFSILLLSFLSLWFNVHVITLVLYIFFAPLLNIYSDSWGTTLGGLFIYQCRAAVINDSIFNCLLIIQRCFICHYSSLLTCLMDSGTRQWFDNGTGWFAWVAHVTLCTSIISWQGYSFLDTCMPYGWQHKAVIW